jgi:dihydropteroate synthase
MHLRLPDGRELSLDRPLIMGILNVTPDSFSDGGRWIDEAAAVAHGLAMATEGADVIDVGGESTRPGSQPVPPDEQISRVVPVIRALGRELESRCQSQLPGVSIDTMSATVARAALEAGASILNDVSAGRGEVGRDEDGSGVTMFDLARAAGAPIVLMHMQGTPLTMQDIPHYGDVVEEVLAFLLERAQAAQDAGVPASQIVIDPGIGFGKSRDHNLTLLANLHRFVATGYPVLLGASRKRFMGAICPPPQGQPPDPPPPPPPPPASLLGATCATTALGVAAGVTVFRVHDVAANRQAADVARAILAGRAGGGPAVP